MTGVGCAASSCSRRSRAAAGRRRGRPRLGPSWIARALLDGRRAAFDVLRVLMALAPLQALDMLVLAVFAKPVVRVLARYVLDPGLRLAVAVALVATDGGVLFLTLGYVRGRSALPSTRPARAARHPRPGGARIARRTHPRGPRVQPAAAANERRGGEGTELAGGDPRPLPPGIGRRRFPSRRVAYVGSALYLALRSFGYYVNAASGSTAPRC